MDFIISARRVGRCMKGNYFRRFRGRNIRIEDSRGIFGRYKKEIWRKRQRNS